MTDIIARFPFYLGGSRPELGEVVQLAMAQGTGTRPHTLVPAGRLTVPQDEAKQLIRSGWCRAPGKDD